MPVTDLQVATLRALLVGEFDKGRELMDQIGEQGLRTGYFPLVMCAFMDAVKDRFRGAKRSDVISWIAEARAERDVDAPLDPNVAERLILWVFDKADTDGIDFTTSSGHQTMLLASLVVERNYDDADLDVFLQRARAAADELMDDPGEA